jgi:hypothetical protein
MGVTSGANPQETCQGDQNDLDQGITSSSNHDHQGSIEPRYGNLAYRGLPGGEESNPRLSLVGESILPAIAKQVTGWAYVEITDQKSFGFVVRALGYSGLDFEKDTPETLAEAMAVLEAGLSKWFKEQGIDIN